MSYHLSLRDEALRAFSGANLELLRTPRVGLVLGTGWSDRAVLENSGFACEREVEFDRFGIHPPDGAGHSNVFRIGRWHDRDVVLSVGRIHLYQEMEMLWSHRDRILRRWFSVFLAIMGEGTRMVVTSSVGGLGDMKQGTVTLVTGLVAAHLLQPYLGTNEFVLGERVVWKNPHNMPTHESDEFYRKRSAFERGASAAELPFRRSRRHLIQGPAFGGALERNIWHSQHCDEVGMSGNAEACLTVVANGDRVQNGIAPIDLMMVGYVTDANDLPIHSEIVE
jgi:purine nucleoside phosphorylase